MSKNSPRSDTAEILDEVRTTNAETPLVLPDPLPDGTNPFLVIQWCLFTAFVAARHLTDERQKRVEQLGRKMRTEEYRGVLHLHREDDVDRHTVEKELNHRLRMTWLKSFSEARKLCATLAIPFSVYDPVLKAAQEQMQDSWEIVWGVASDKEVHVRNDITKRLYELAESTTQAVIVPVAAPELGSNGTKQSEGGTPADEPRLPPEWVTVNFRSKQYTILSELFRSDAVTESELCSRCSYDKPDNLRRRITELNKNLLERRAAIGDLWVVRKRIRNGTTSYWIGRQK